LLDALSPRLGAVDLRNNDLDATVRARDQEMAVHGRMQIWPRTHTCSQLGPVFTVGADTRANAEPGRGSGRSAGAARAGVAGSALLAHERWGLRPGTGALRSHPGAGRRERSPAGRARGLSVTRFPHHLRTAERLAARCALKRAAAALPQKGDGRYHPLPPALDAIQRKSLM
jgi:hypothetical protein